MIAALWFVLQVLLLVIAIVCAAAFLAGCILGLLNKPEHR
jgi:hypothetical protein